MAGDVSARPYDALADGAKRCSRYFAKYEQEYGLPEHLLSAIAVTESGRYHQGLKMTVPWPWTINAQGKGYFFDTKSEAIQKINDLRAAGVKSADVGCMQVNLYYHPNAFSSLQQAFEPQYNIRYAAQFLKSNYDETGSWKQAVAYYHSKTDVHGKAYAKKVLERWEKHNAMIASNGTFQSYLSSKSHGPKTYSFRHLSDNKVQRRKSNILVTYPRAEDKLTGGDADDTLASTDRAMTLDEKLKLADASLGTAESEGAVANEAGAPVMVPRPKIIRIGRKAPSVERKITKDGAARFVFSN